jgi:hypothetical protein
MMFINEERIEQREDEMAHLITASEGVDNMRQAASVLCKQGKIDTRLYRDMRDTLDQVTAALLIARRNTAQLRNGRR